MYDPTLKNPNCEVWDNKRDDEFIYQKDKESKNYHWDYTVARPSFPNNRKGSSWMFWKCGIFPNEEIKNEYQCHRQFITTSFDST